jgi:hypothetical protein
MRQKNESRSRKNDENTQPPTEDTDVKEIWRKKRRKELPQKQKFSNQIFKQNRQRFAPRQIRKSGG